MTRSSEVVARAEHGGFVLALVVFMLFAISVAGAAGYLIVASEFAMARYSSEGGEALAVARAGIERFVGEHSGTVPDTVSYAMGDGVVVVTTRKLAETDSVTHLYTLKAEATVADPRTPATPARRVVTAQAILHRRPLPHLAALITSANAVTVHSFGDADGADHNTSLDCVGGGASAITGGVARGAISGVLNGSPASEIWPGGWDAIRDSIVARWDVLSDPDFPVDYENTLPALGSIPADSFPLVRFTGYNLTSTSGDHNKGVLIWVGELRPWLLFNWEGIVLAENIGQPFLGFLGGGSVDGMLIGGLNADNSPSTLEVRTDVRYHSCNVYQANETLSYFELLSNTMFEAR